MFQQLLSITGAVLILVAYALLQLRRIGTDTATYQIMNFFGGLFLFLAAVILRQVGFMLVEGMWALLSLMGLVRVIRRS